jgi:Spy/CpxP family protein refolding chaperone
MLTRLKNEVGLTADQEAKAKPIVDKYASDRAVIRDDASLDSAAKRQKFVALKTQYDSDINGVLTPAQQKKLAGAQAQNRERLKAAREKRAAGGTNAAPSPSPAPKQ